MRDGGLFTTSWRINPGYMGGAFRRTKCSLTRTVDYGRNIRDYSLVDYRLREGWIRDEGRGIILGHYALKDGLFLFTGEWGLLQKDGGIITESWRFVH